ncbi:MAG: hypothetical protein KGY49_03770, partial [Wenzhouxiangellaceae bacterium]|nr:hypothetical protein [Wenzhouxiangellaceae bacterium]
MKVGVNLIRGCIFACAMAITSTAAAQTPNVQIGGATGAAGQPVNISLEFNDTTTPSTASFDFTIQFDTSLMGSFDLTNCTGTLVGSENNAAVQCNSPNTGEVRVIVTTNPPVAIGDGAVGQIELTLAGDAPIGSFPIVIEGENYFAANGDNITPESSGSIAGEVQVSGPALTFDPSTGLVDAGEAEVTSSTTPNAAATIDIEETGTDDVRLASCVFANETDAAFNFDYA